MEIIAPHNTERFADAGNCVTGVKLCPNTSFVLPDRPPWCLSSVGVQTEKEEERQLTEKENTFPPAPARGGRREKDGGFIANFFCRETSVTLGEGFVESAGMLHQKSLVIAPIHAKDAIARKKDCRGNGENPSSLHEKTSSNAAPPHFKLFFSRYFFHEVGSTIIFLYPRQIPECQR